MADHTVTLSSDEEATLTAQAQQTQDPAVTVDTLLAALVHNTLAPSVQKFVALQMAQVQQVFLIGDPQGRAALVQFLAQSTKPPTLSATLNQDGTIASVTLTKAP